MSSNIEMFSDDWEVTPGGEEWTEDYIDYVALEGVFPDFTFSSSLSSVTPFTSNATGSQENDEMKAVDEAAGGDREGVGPCTRWSSCNDDDRRDQAKRVAAATDYISKRGITNEVRKKPRFHVLNRMEKKRKTVSIAI